jgi:NlpC/P60 family putative phage cell wall peptidase
MTAAPSSVPISPIALERTAVLAEARTWVGTPFHHRARLKGVGVDCAHFLMACYVGLGVVEPFDPGFYAPDWFLHEPGERFREWVARACVETTAPQPGDVALFRFGRCESHGAILVDHTQLIHAYRGHGVVIEDYGPGTPLSTRLSSQWTPRRWAAATGSMEL